MNEGNRSDRGLWKIALITVPAIVIVGSVMGLLSNSGFDNEWYAALNKPAFQRQLGFGVVGRRSIPCSA